MLRYDIQCIFRHFARFNVLIHHFPGNNDTVQQIPAGPWYNPPFADSIQPVTGTAQPLHSPCDGFGRSGLEPGSGCLTEYSGTFRKSAEGTGIPVW